MRWLLALLLFAGCKGVDPPIMAVTYLYPEALFFPATLATFPSGNVWEVIDEDPIDTGDYVYHQANPVGDQVTTGAARYGFQDPPADPGAVAIQVALLANMAATPDAIDPHYGFDYGTVAFTDSIETGLPAPTITPSVGGEPATVIMDMGFYNPVTGDLWQWSDLQDVYFNHLFSLGRGPDTGEVRLFRLRLRVTYNLDLDEEIPSAVNRPSGEIGVG